MEGRGIILKVRDAGAKEGRKGDRIRFGVRQREEGKGMGRR